MGAVLVGNELPDVSNAMITIPYILPCLVILLQPLNQSWGGPETPTETKKHHAASAKKLKSIGVAWLEKDGTLVLQLRAESPGGATGDALIMYKPTDKLYNKILQHIGPLRKGETKFVPPWPKSE